MSPATRTQNPTELQSSWYSSGDTADPYYALVRRIAGHHLIEAAALIAAALALRQVLRR